MNGERTVEARAHVPATDRDSEETLRLPFAVVLHLVPGALLLVTVLVLAPRSSSAVCHTNSSTSPPGCLPSCHSCSARCSSTAAASTAVSR